MDIQYNLYQQRYERGTEASILTDWVVLGMGGASAVMGGRRRGGSRCSNHGGHRRKVSSIRMPAAKALPRARCLYASVAQSPPSHPGTGLGADRYPLAQAAVDLGTTTMQALSGAIWHCCISGQASRKASEELKVVT